MIGEDAALGYPVEKEESNEDIARRVLGLPEKEEITDKEQKAKEILESDKYSLISKMSELEHTLNLLINYIVKIDRKIDDIKKNIKTKS